MTIDATDSDRVFWAQGLILALALLALTVVSGCMRPTPSPTEILSSSLTQYHGHLIFERFDEAAGFVPVPQRQDFLDYYEEQRGDLYITEFELTRLEVAGDEHEARAEVLVTWYKLPSAKVVTTRMEQMWSFDTEREVWEIVNQEVIDESSPMHR